MPPPAVLTERGGITSHAAVIGRGMGLPCVVGVSDITIQARKKRLVVAPEGRVLKAGDVITIDGTSGEILAGERAAAGGGTRRAFQEP